MDTPRLYGDLSWVWPLLSPPDAYPEEAGVIASSFEKAGVGKGGTLLHLGCGGGSLDFHLQQRFTVTGVDRSPSMLERAGELNPEVEYVVGDMRDCDLSRTFDAVLLHDAQAYLTELEELEGVYRTAARHLKPGGVFVSVPQELRERFVQNGVSSSTSNDGGNPMVTTIELAHDADPDDRVFETTFIFVIRREGHQRVEVDVHRMGLWALDEVLERLEHVGFAPEVSRPTLAAMPDRPVVVVTARKRE